MMWLDVGANSAAQDHKLGEIAESGILKKSAILCFQPLLVTAHLLKPTSIVKLDFITTSQSLVQAIKSEPEPFNKNKNNMKRRIFKTNHIKPSLTDNLVQAAFYAHEIGSPLNRHITIAWESAGCLGRIQEYQGRFFERLTKWIKYQKILPAYVWTIENGYVQGLHSHILCHVPKIIFRRFGQKVDKWVDGDVQSNTAKITTIRYDRYVDNLSCLRGVLKYILKGVDPDAAKTFEIIPKSQGIVYGKRCGTSQNIGRTARQRIQWIDKPLQVLPKPFSGGPELIPFASDRLTAKDQEKPP